MSEANPRVEAFYARAKAWREELAALRAILRDSPLTEEFKWRSPCYTFGGGNVALVWGFKDCCALGFFKGVLLKDPAGILAAPGENSRSARLVRFTGVGQIASAEAVLRDYIREAIVVEKAGLKVEFRKDDLDYPAELTGMLEHDPTLKAAFEALTPGRRRAYLLHFSQPKQSATRTARIERCRPRIFAGKGFNER